MVSPHATQLVVVAPPPATPAPRARQCAVPVRALRRIYPAPPTTCDDRHHAWLCKIASLLVDRRRDDGAADGWGQRSRAEQSRRRFASTPAQLQASARIGSHPTHILPARRQQLIIITRFLTKTKKNEKKTHRHPHQSIGSVRHVEAYWRRRRASPPAGPHPDGLTLWVEIAETPFRLPTLLASPPCVRSAYVSAHVAGVRMQLHRVVGGFFHLWLVSTT